MLEALSRLIHDGWENVLTGLGTAADKMRSTMWVAGTTITPAITYSQIYRDMWLARRVVQVFPENALRKRPEIVDEANPEALWKRYDELNASEQYPHGVLAQALYQGRLYGGAQLLMNFAFGDPREPAPEPGGARGEITWIDAVPWHQLTVVKKETDENSPRYGLPLIYRITDTHVRRGLEFHASRAIPCEGAARAEYEPDVETPWVSVLDPVLETLKRYDTAWQSVGYMLSEASIGVMKLRGLIGMITSKNESVVQARMQLMSQGRSVAHTVFLDADGGEDFSRVETSFAGVSPVMQDMALQVSGATEIPVAILLGQAPAGLNATGENDRAQFDEKIAVYRGQAVAPKQTRLLSYLAGRPVTLRYPPVREMTAAEQAEVRAKNAESDNKYWTMGVLNELEIAESRSADGSLGVTIDLAAKKAEIEAADKEAEEAARNLPPTPPDPDADQDLDQNEEA